jgi:sec-independent protein translocase protein TatA
MAALIWNNGPWEWIIILVVVLIFFGAGKLPAVLGQMGKGVKSFKEGIKEGEEEAKTLTQDLESSISNESVTEAEEIKRG